MRVSLCSKLTLMVLIVAFAAVSAMHWGRGAFDSGFGAADDEAAHMVSGVMAHDYIVDPDPLHPVRFAENYYVHYPKVAIGQWPPGYHALQAIWTLVFGVSRESIVLLSALLTALVAALIFRATVAELGKPAALGASALFLLLPIVQRFGSMSMTEVPLTFFCLAAVLAFGKLLDLGRGRDGLLFAVCSAAAILTKANALALALVPPIAIAMRQQWELARSKALWISAAVVAVCAGPWTIHFKDVNITTWEGGPGLSWNFSRNASIFLARELFVLGGAAVLIAALWGVRTQLSKPHVAGKWHAGAAFCIALLVFHITLPTSIESRHLIMLTPFLCMFAAAGMLDLVSRVQTLRPRAGVISAALVLFSFAALAWEFPQKRFKGFDEAVAYVNSRPDYEGAAVLIDSGSTGEGLAVTEFVLADSARPSRYVVRATKFLSRSTWTGKDYQCLYTTPEETAAALERLPICLVLFDHSIDSHQHMPHHDILQRMLRTNAAWRLVRTFDVQRGDRIYSAGLELWEHSASAERKPIDLEFAAILGRDLPL